MVSRRSRCMFCRLSQLMNCIRPLLLTMLLLRKLPVLLRACGLHDCITPLLNATGSSLTRQSFTPLALQLRIVALLAEGHAIATLHCSRADFVGALSAVSPAFSSFAISASVAFRSPLQVPSVKALKIVRYGCRRCL